MPATLPHIFDLTPDSLTAWCSERDMPAYRATQVLEWVYRTGVVDPARMTNLAKAERDRLAREMGFLAGEPAAHQIASDGVHKLLLAWRDAPASYSEPPREPGCPQPAHLESDKAVSEQTQPARGRAGSLHSPSIPVMQQANATGLPVVHNADPSRATECVMIPTASRKTACVSSQVGCPVGCRFCASGLDGLTANLTAGQIVEQVWRLARLPGVERITNVVFMGMGEPLANLDNVARAIRTISAPWGLGVSARRITVSTVGLPQAIERFAERMDLPVTLALSLHAPTDELRRELIPWAAYSTIDELLAACGRWFEKTGREITLEYTLLGGVNDSSACARRLAEIARTLRSNVNLIRYNEVEGLPFARPRDDAVRAFQRALQETGVNSHIRASRGRDIAAACGQLRRAQAGADAPSP